MKRRSRLAAVLLGVGLATFGLGGTSHAGVTYCTSGYIDGYPENAGRVGWHTQYLGCIGNSTEACMGGNPKFPFEYVACFI